MIDVHSTEATFETPAAVVIGGEVMSVEEARAFLMTLNAVILDADKQNLDIKAVEKNVSVAVEAKKTEDMW